MRVPRRRSRIVVPALALVALVVAVLAGWRTVGLVAAWPVQVMRRISGPALAPVTGPAVNQLGYAPMGPKAFTAAGPIVDFTVVEAASRRLVLRGRGLAGPPNAEGTAPSAWTGDFTAVRSPGRYRIVVDGGSPSPPFTIASDVYDAAIRAVQRVFYYQRAFTAIEAVHAEGPWRHASDAARAPAGVRGGWHDAGDYSLYNMTTVSSIFWLLSAALDFAPTDDATNLPESGNRVPDLLDEARWGLEWLLSVQDAEGGVRNSTCLASYQAYGRNDPAVGPPYVDGEVGTLPTARGVGVLAFAAHVFAPIDAVFAHRLAEAAARGWQYLEARPEAHTDGPTCAAYRQDGDVPAGRAARRFAAAGLLVATGDPRFRSAFAAWADQAGEPGDPSPYRFGAYAALLYRRAAAADPAVSASLDAGIEVRAAATRAAIAAHPQAWPGGYQWGSLAIAFERVAGALIPQCLTAARADAPACRLATASLDYALGRNPLQLVYVSGLPGVTTGRRHAFHHWLATLEATPFLFPGALAGGPNQSPHELDGSRPLARPRAVWGYWGDPAMPRHPSTPLDARYTDNDSWSTNELAIAWQAPALYTLLFAQWQARRAESAAGQPAADVREDAGRGLPVAVRIHR